MQSINSQFPMDAPFVGKGLEMFHENFAICRLYDYSYAMRKASVGCLKSKTKRASHDVAIEVEEIEMKKVEEEEVPKTTNIAVDGDSYAENDQVNLNTKTGKTDSDDDGCNPLKLLNQNSGIVVGVGEKCC